MGKDIGQWGMSKRVEAGGMYGFTVGLSSD
jgi:hypothetical protein